MVKLYRADHKAMFTVGELVLMAHVGPRPPGHVVRHFPDRNRHNNRLANLSWSTQKDNLADRHVHGTSPRGKPFSGGVRRGASNPRSRLTEADIPTIRRLHNQGMTPGEIKVRFGVDSCTIRDVICGRTWRHVL